MGGLEGPRSHLSAPDLLVNVERIVVIPRLHEVLTDDEEMNWLFRRDDLRRVGRIRSGAIPMSLL